MSFDFSEHYLFLAPLAGYTDSSFRRVCKKGGAHVVITEMVNGRGLLDPLGRKKQQQFLAFENEEKPIGLQIFGNDPFIMADAALVGENLGFDFIDINMGCPVKKVLKTGAGAALLKDIKKASSIVRKIKENISVPLTVKIRTGWDEKDRSYLPLSEALAEEGADALFVHPRCVDKGMGGDADHRKTREIKELLPHVYIITNGGIFSAEDALNVMDITGCRRIMVGRGALRNPLIFFEIESTLNGTTSSHTGGIRHAVLSHYENLSSVYGERAPILFRKCLAWYTKSLPGSSEFRQRMNSIHNPEEMLGELKGYFNEVD